MSCCAGVALPFNNSSGTSDVSVTSTGLSWTISVWCGAGARTLFQSFGHDRQGSKGRRQRMVYCEIMFCTNIWHKIALGDDFCTSCTMIPGVIIEGNTMLGDSIWCCSIWSKSPLFHFAEQNALSPFTSWPLAGHCHGGRLPSSSGRC